VLSTTPSERRQEFVTAQTPFFIVCTVDKRQRPTRKHSVRVTWCCFCFDYVFRRWAQWPTATNVGKVCARNNIAKSTDFKKRMLEISKTTGWN